MIEKNEEYRVLDVIYSSQYTTIYRALEVETNHTVIIKSLNEEFNNPINFFKIKSRYDLLKKFESNYIIKVHKLFEFDNRCAILYEDFGGVILSQYLKKNRLELKEFLDLAIKITKCIEYIHTKNIIHKNINPDNILYNADEKMVKLFGFENASKVSFENVEAINPRIFYDNLFYISPEQTGRMNRPIDYRTDFYSLGITLYELACSKLPFASLEAAEMVYFHMAKTPVPVHQINDKIPLAVSKIIMKLMEKVPEDRYKSTYGIEYDLLECLRQFQELGRIVDFELAKNDYANKLEIPKKIYGRELELNTLLGSFERAKKSQAGFAIIDGEDGIGKTALVNELHKPILKNRGIFITSKCYAYNENIPYAALSHALDQFCAYMLSESTAEVKKYKEKIINLIGDSVYLLLDSIPKLNLIIEAEPIGSQHRDKEELITLMQNKFCITLMNFLKAISSLDRPIVFFFDDIQWIDIASLELIESIAFDSKFKGVLFICTYKKDEVDEEHPLQKGIKRIKKAKGRVVLLHLENLKVDAVAELLQDVLNCDAEKANGLAEIMQEKTLGNPFYLSEFLKYCNDENLFIYETSDKVWKWDNDKIKNSKTSDNVVNLLVKKIKILPPQTKELLLIAACIGNRFDIKILSAISGKNMKDIKQALNFAISSEMIYVRAKNGLHMQKEEFIFCHDRIHQAVYYVLSENEREAIYLNIINYYERKAGLKNSSEMFILADLYTKVLDRVEESHMDKVISILTYAAKIARLTSAFESAKHYLELVLEMTPEQLRKDKVFILPIYEEYHLVLFNLMEYTRGDYIYTKMQGIATDPVEMVNACCVQLTSLCRRNKPQIAYSLGVELLGELGIKYHGDQLEHAILEELEKLYQFVHDDGLESLDKKYMIFDENEMSIAKLLNRIASGGVLFSAKCAQWAALASANFMFEKGISYWSLEALCLLTPTLAELKNDYSLGYEMSKKSIATLKKIGFSQGIYRAYFFDCALNCHWFEPLENSIYSAQRAFKGNMKSGDVNLSCYCLFPSQSSVLECCNTLEEMQTEIDAAVDLAMQQNTPYARETFSTYQQLVKALKGTTFRAGSFNDDTFDEEEYRRSSKRNGFELAVFYIYKALTEVLYSHFESAYELTRQAEKYLSFVSAHYVSALYVVLNSIAICKTFDKVENEEAQSMRVKLQKNQVWLSQRAKDAPNNFEHLYDLVQAMIHALDQQYDDAFRLFEKAVTGAEKNRRPYHYALITELIGQCYLKIGIKKTANYYINEAHCSYLEWGALGKVANMKKAYQHILTSGTSYACASIKNNSLYDLDLNAIIHVSQTIFSEKETDNLLEKLMEILIQNSSSTLGHVLIKNENKVRLLVSGSVEKDIDVTICQNEILLDQPKAMEILPVSLINYVVMTREILIIDNIYRSQFAYDTYFENTPIKSVLCLPIMQQDHLKGIVYLENNKLTGAFTRTNTQVLSVIASQAAISIENAFLYTELEDKVKERTLQLEETISKLKVTNEALEQEINQRITTEIALEESEKQILLSKEYDKMKTDFFSNISHELRTPINVIFSALQIHMSKQQVGKCQVKECYKYGHIMQQNCYRLLRLINNLIDITKIDTGYFRVNPVNINMVSLIENITASVANYVEDKGLSLIFDTDTEEKIMACDPEKIERIILNLLSNAVKFTPTGGEIQVIIKSKKSKITIHIKDTGRGIPREKQDVIFKRFVQVDKSFSRDHEGSGIGLSLVKDLVALHDGTISVKSKVNRGSEFIVMLPCKLVQQEEVVSYTEETSKANIEKINIEFSDIYK